MALLAKIVRRLRRLWEWARRLRRRTDHTTHQDARSAEPPRRGFGVDVNAEAATGAGLAGPLTAARVSGAATAATDDFEMQRSPDSALDRRDPSPLNSPSVLTAPTEPPPVAPSSEAADKKSSPRAPRAIGGRRNQPHQSLFGQNAAGHRPPLTPRPELICRAAAGLWEVLLFADDECEVAEVCHDTGPLSRVYDEWPLPAIDGRLTISFASGEQRELSLFDGAAPLIFKLGSKWTGVGRKVDSISSGHFIVIAPNTWQRTGQAPVAPQQCTGVDFTAHYFFARNADQASADVDVGGFKECQVALASVRFKLDGRRVFDDSAQGPLFVGAVPILRPASEVVWARIGEEQGGCWKGANFSPTERSLADVLQGRQGRFFLRVYDAEKLLDSGEFRYYEDLREIEVNGTPYTSETLLVPPACGHSPTEVRFVGANGVPLAPNICDGQSHAAVAEHVIIIESNPDADEISCTLESSTGGISTVIRLPRVWWRVEDVGDFSEWRDTPLVMTRQEFREQANANMAIRIRMPAHIDSVKVGFDDVCDRSYRTTETVPIGDFVDYTQVDQRLIHDATLNAQCGNMVLPLVRISADLVPEVISFTCEPETIVVGKPAKLRWTTRNAKSAHVTVEPEVGPVEHSGSIRVFPSVDMTYILKLTTSPGSDDQTTSAIASVRVTQPDIPLRDWKEIWRNWTPEDPRFTWRFLIVKGNRSGHVGYGIGKGTKQTEALFGGRNEASRSVVWIPRNGSTIPRSVDGTFGDTQVFLEPAPSGTGINAVWAIRNVMELAGVKDLACRVVGPSNAISVVKAVFDALRKLEPASDAL